MCVIDWKNIYNICKGQGIEIYKIQGCYKSVRNKLTKKWMKYIKRQFTEKEMKAHV